MPLTIESLTKTMQGYMIKCNQSQQMVHQLNGAIQVLQNQIQELTKGEQENATEKGRQQEDESDTAEHQDGDTERQEA